MVLAVCQGALETDALLRLDDFEFLGQSTTRLPERHDLGLLRRFTDGIQLQLRLRLILIYSLVIELVLLILESIRGVGLIRVILQVILVAEPSQGGIASIGVLTLN